MDTTEAPDLPSTPQRFKVLCGTVLAACILYNCYKYVDGMIQNYSAPEAFLRAGFYTLGVMFMMTILLMLGYMVWCSYALTDRHEGFTNVHHAVRFPSLCLLLAVAAYQFIMSGDAVVMAILCVFFLASLTALQLTAYWTGWMLRKCLKTDP